MLGRLACARRSVTLDNALTARGLEATAELAGLAGRRERPRHDAVINPLGAKIGASNDGCPVPELAGELLLQRAERRLRVGFAALRRNLDDITGCSIRRGGWWRRGYARRGRRECTLRWRRGRRRGIARRRPRIKRERGTTRSSLRRPRLRRRGRDGCTRRRTGGSAFARFGSVRPNRECGYP